jgi:hypothetical protein
MSIRRVKLTGLLVLALLVPGSSQAQQAAPSAAVTASVSSGSTPIIENAGQWPAPARFQVWDSPLGAGTTWLAEAVFIANVVAPIEQPSAGTFVSGTITLQGFAIDLTSSAGTGIDRVHIYLDGLYDVGGATYGLDRPDIAARYGARYGPSGWELVWDASGATPGVHSLYLYAHRTTDDAWTVLSPHLVVVRGEHWIWLPLGIKS